MKRGEGEGGEEGRGEEGNLDFLLGLLDVGEWRRFVWFFPMYVCPSIGIGLVNIEIFGRLSIELISTWFHLYSPTCLVSKIMSSSPNLTW